MGIDLFYNLLDLEFLLAVPFPRIINHASYDSIKDTSLWVDIITQFKKKVNRLLSDFHELNDLSISNVINNNPVSVCTEFVVIENSISTILQHLLPENVSMDTLRSLNKILFNQRNSCLSFLMLETYTFNMTTHLPPFYLGAT